MDKFGAGSDTPPSATSVVIEVAPAVVVIVEVAVAE
jgi:hypothetical protein